MSQPIARRRAAAATHRVRQADHQRKKNMLAIECSDERDAAAAIGGTIATTLSVTPPGGRHPDHQNCTARR